MRVKISKWLKWRIELISICFRPFRAFHTKMRARDFMRVFSIYSSNHNFLSWNGNLVIIKTISTHFQQLTTLRNAYALKKPKTRIYQKWSKIAIFQNEIALQNVHWPPLFISWLERAWVEDTISCHPDPIEMQKRHQIGN